MPRVLHLIKGMGPGGAERLLVSLAGERAPDLELEVAYLLPHKDQLVAEMEAAGVPCHLIGSSAGVADLRWLVQLRGLVERLRPDIVHVHSPAVAALARPVLRFTTRPRPVLVSTEHNVWPSFGRITRLANALSLPLDDARLAVSDEVRDSSWRPYRARTEVLIQGIPLARLHARTSERAEARAAMGVGPDDVLAVTVANLREKKDYPMLLEVARRCADVSALRFVAIGQGPLEDELHALHRSLGLGDRFRFLGYHPDPPAVVVAADLFLLTSRHEGLPIALLEAMALGVPPVATAVGGVPRVVTDRQDGVLVDAGDVARFTSVVRELALDPMARRALGAKAARRAAEFDVASTARALDVRYRALLAPPT